MGLPVRLVYKPTGKVVLDPDTIVCNKPSGTSSPCSLHRLGTSDRAAVQRRWVVVPDAGAHRRPQSELAWMPLRHWRVLRTLHNPRYAGAFAYGRRRERLAAGGKKTLDTLPREQWIALIHDAHPGYISFDQYDQQRLRRRRPCAGRRFVVERGGDLLPAGV
jgi:hypothetical protein